MKLNKWHILLIVIFVFIIIFALLFLRKVMFYKKAIEQGSIIIEKNVFEYSSYGGPINVTESSATRAEIESGKNPWKGSDKPIMTIVEFSDFNCPYSLSAYYDLKLFVNENKDSVKLIYKDFLISEDIKASISANCADEQGKFWEMHDKLFENQRILSESAFFKFANEIGLDITKFQECYNSEIYKSEIYNDTSLGLRAGVQGTPTFFVNGEKFQGVIPIEIWRQILEVAKNEN